MVDKVYRSEEGEASVRTLPQSPKTFGMILGAVLIQTEHPLGRRLSLMRPVLGEDNGVAELLFGAVLVTTKIVPRDLGRLLLTTYPKKRMAIELSIDIMCALVVAFVFAHLIPYAATVRG